MTDKESHLSPEDHESSINIQQLPPESPETKEENLRQKTHTRVKKVLTKKTRRIGTSEVILRNWHKRKPKDEWYDVFKYAPRRIWENAGDKSKLI